MFRTRDYAVMLLIIAFLVIAIAVTLKGSFSFGFGVKQGAAIFTASGEEKTYSAQVADTEMSRAERIASLKKKIASRDNDLAFTESAPEVIPEVPEVPGKTEEIKENRCGGYVRYTGAWSPAGLIIAEAEGGRLIYREGASPVLTASSTLLATPVRDIVAQLPVRNVPLASQSCITMDVIGIAKDGSLIRNNEIGMYKIFSSDTLVGYALDGYPIYGRGSAATDICGGVMVAGQYRYQLADDREIILNCYAGVPIAL